MTERADGYANLCQEYCQLGKRCYFEAQVEHQHQSQESNQETLRKVIQSCGSFNLDGFDYRTVRMLVEHPGRCRQKARVLEALEKYHSDGFPARLNEVARLLKKLNQEENQADF